MLHFERELVRQANAELEINGVFYVSSRLPEENDHSLLQNLRKLLVLGMAAATENYSARTLSSSNHNCNLQHILMVDRQNSRKNSFTETRSSKTEEFCRQSYPAVPLHLVCILSVPQVEYMYRPTQTQTASLRDLEA